MMAMDKPSVGGLPWLDKPVMFHSSRADKCKMTPEQCAYRSGHWRYWYEADHVYSLNTTYFLCATVGVFMLAHLSTKYAPVQVKRSSMWRKMVAIGRYSAYKNYQLSSLHYHSPSVGVIALGLVGTVFFFAMTLGPKPYYWPNTKDGSVAYGNSPPIATRAGWMALALLPFVLALGTKVNLVSMLTGVSHEKLQVFHQWTSYAMFVLALVHTFPFIVYDIWRGKMVKQWNTSMVYWTGVATLIPQAYLTFMSLPTIRNRYYEFFKATHFLVALLFTLFFFFHCDFRLSSWDYFVAGGAVYLFSLVAAWTRTHLVHGRHTATTEVLSCGLVRIRIPTITSWRPGQHVFIRFLSPQLGMHCLTSHPFTISSLPHDPDKSGKASEMVFYIKARHGITARLASIASNRPKSPMTVFLEGPYGGIPDTTNPTSFDTTLVISGGSGGGFSLGIIEQALSAYSNHLPTPQSRKLQIIFAARDPQITQWYEDEIDSMLSTHNQPPNTISVSIHDTSPAQSPAEPRHDLHIPGKKARTGADLHTRHIVRGPRPDLPQMIATAASRSDGRMAVFACGPASMLLDVRNGAADAQKRVYSRGAEVYLHAESFAW